MDKQSRRDAVRDYKERKVPAGIFVVRCAASGQVWVGQSRNLDGQKNSFAFGLKMGQFRNPALDAAHKAHGADSISYEVVEVVDDEELSPMGRDDLLKKREAHWRTELGAAKLFG